MTVEPCPECGNKDVRVITEHTSGSMIIHCPECGLHHTLKIKLPCVPEEIIEEWNAYCRVQRRIKGSETMTELKPCPFCGMTDVKLNHYKVKGNDWWYIACPHCQIAMDPWRWNDGQTREEAIKRWNRRVNV